MNVGDVAKRAGLVTGVAAGVVGALYAGERAVAAQIRRGGESSSPDEDLLLPDVETTSRIATHDGGELYVVEHGTGTPIVFAHGVTLTSQVWAHQFRSFPAAGFRTVAFDGRGHGQSTMGETGHSIDNLAADLRTVLERLDLRDAIVVGHSMGGMAVQGLAVHHPDVVAERVAGMVLLSSSARSFASDARRVRGGLDRASAVAPTVGALFRQRNLGLLVARLGFGDAPDPRCVEAVRQMLGACPHETLREAGRSLLTLDFVDDLPRLSVPTLVVVGTSDVLTPPRESQVIADLVPGAELVELAGAGHMLMYERTEELDALIVDFSRQCLAERVEHAALRHLDGAAVRSGAR